MFEVKETGNPEVPLYFGEGLRRSLGNAAGCGGGGKIGLPRANPPWSVKSSGLRKHCYELS